MQTVTIELFKFNELSEAAKETAIEQYRNSIGDVLWYFSDDIKEQLREENITLEKNGLQYDLSHCQGDGLSFAGDFDVLKMVKMALPNLSEKRQNIIDKCIYSLYSSGNTGHYCYASKNDIDIEYNYSSWDSNRYYNLTALCEIVVEFTKDYYIDLCNKFEKQGYAEIEYQYSNEAIVENIIENDYQFFTIDGKRY
jgi:hypothetical protein